MGAVRSSEHFDLAFGLDLFPQRREKSQVCSVLMLWSSVHQFPMERVQRQS